MTVSHTLPRNRETRRWSRDDLDDWLGVTLDGLAAILVVDMPHEAIITPTGCVMPTIRPSLGAGPQASPTATAPTCDD